MTAIEKDSRPPFTILLSKHGRDIRRYLENRPFSLHPVVHLPRRKIRSPQPHRCSCGQLRRADAVCAREYTMTVRAIATQKKRTAPIARRCSKVGSNLSMTLQVSDPSEARGKPSPPARILDQGVSKLGLRLATQARVQAALWKTMGEVVFGPVAYTAKTRRSSISRGQSHQAVGPIIKTHSPSLYMTTKTLQRRGPHCTPKQREESCHTAARHEPVGVAFPRIPITVKSMIAILASSTGKVATRKRRKKCSGDLRD